MKLKDTLQETYTALSANKVRSGLTILGIVIGIASVISLVAIGTGAQTSIQNNIQSIGSNLLTVRPGAQGGPGQQINQGRGTARTLTKEDADAIAAEIQNIKAVSPETQSRYQITATGTNTNVQVVGSVPGYPIAHTVNVSEGSFISEGNVKSGAKVAVIGPTVRDDLFGEGGDAIGKKIRINKNEFKVIGVTESKGGTGFNNPDELVFIPLTTAQRYFTGDQYVSNISISAESAEVMTQVQNEVTTLLLERHRINDPESPDFNIMNQADIVATASTITSTLTILLAAIAGISLVVGGIGIMNMMLTTVTERTREIGLRKAIGAKQKDIRLQFLAEAIVLTLIGGIVGISLGASIAFAITYFNILQTTISLYSIGLAFGVSAAIGIIFGYYPARKAAALNPIDALRYE
jgi:putative ABC transport system permease protein